MVDECLRPFFKNIRSYWNTSRGFETKMTEYNICIYIAFIYYTLVCFGVAAVQHERGPRNSTLRRQMCLLLKPEGAGPSTQDLGSKAHHGSPQHFFPHHPPPPTSPTVSTTAFIIWTQTINKKEEAQEVSNVHTICATSLHSASVSHFPQSAVSCCLSGLVVVSYHWCLYLYFAVRWSAQQSRDNLWISCTAPLHERALGEERSCLYGPQPEGPGNTHNLSNGVLVVHLWRHKHCCFS